MIARKLIAGVLVLAAASARRADAGCPDPLGRWGYGPTSAVAVSGSTVFAGRGSVLMISDWSVPAAPVVLGELVLPGFIYGIAVSGTRVLVAAGADGLRVIDVSNPAAPVEIGSAASDGEAFGVAVADGHALVAAGWQGLKVFELAASGVPGLVATLALPGINASTAVAVSGDLAVAADGTSGVRVIDLSSPAAPTLLATVEVPDRANDVAVVGTYAYVAAGSAGLRVIDLAAPGGAAEVGSLDTEGQAIGVGVDGTRAVVADGGPGLVAVDVSNPSSPSLLGVANTPGSASRVAAVSGRAFVADDAWGVRGFDVSGAAAPAPLGVIDGFGNAVGVAVVGTHAWVADPQRGVRGLDLSDPASPKLVASLSLTGERYAIAAAGSLVLTRHLGDLAVIDVSNPAAPALRGISGPIGDAREIAVTGSIAVVASGDAGVRVVDFATATAPVVIAVVDTPGYARGVSVAGDLAFVADGDAGLRILDIGTPSAPIEVGSLDTEGEATGVAVMGQHVLVADRNEGVLVVDASVPTAPLHVGSYRSGLTVTAVAATGHHAFVNIDGISVLDVRDPANPFLVTALAMSEWPDTLVVAGTTLLSAQNRSGVGVFGVAQCLLVPEVTVLAGAAALSDGQAAAVSFGTVVQGSAGASRAFTVRNDGGGLLALGAVALPPGYTLVESLAATLGPGESDTFTVRLDAAAPGTKAGQVSFATSDADEDPFNFSVTGKINPPPPRRFDFGTASSPVAAGFSRVSHATTYSPALGYGWLAGTVASRDRVTGSDLNRDLNFTPLASFVVDVPDGSWDVTITLGDATTAHDQMGVCVVNDPDQCATVSSVAGQFVTQSLRAAVTGGQLIVKLDDLGGRDLNVAVTSLVVTPPWPHRFDFGTATSPVYPGYTRVTHATAYSAAVGYGWSGGAVGSRDRAAGDDLDRDFNFTVAAIFSVDLPNGTYSVIGRMGDATTGHDDMRLSLEGGEVRTETLLRGVWTTWSEQVTVSDGQLTVGLTDGGGTDANTVINSLTVVPANRHFDFGTATSPARGGYAGVTAATAYSPVAGCGWLAGTIQARDRGTPDSLRRDFNFTPDGTFAIDLPNGSYILQVTVGDATTAHDQMGFFAEGVLQASLSTAAGQFLEPDFFGVEVRDGQLTLRLDDLGGLDPNVVINGLEINPAGPF